MRIRILFRSRCKLLLRTVFLGFEPVFLLEFAVEIGLVRNPHAVHDLLNGEVGGRQQAGRILETVLLDEFARRASRNLLELPVEIAGRQSEAFSNQFHASITGRKRPEEDDSCNNQDQ